MSDKTSAEVVAELQRKLDAVESAVYHLCHMGSSVKFSTFRRDGDTVYAASLRFLGDEKIECCDGDTADFLKRVGNAVFENHISELECRSRRE